jgi:hypothetical protein
MNIVECLGCKKPVDTDRDDIERQVGFRGTYLLVKCPECKQELIIRPGPGDDACEQGRLPETAAERARALFADAGLAFPTIPEELAVKLKEQDRWLFSTRKLKMSPYNLQYYVDESDGVNRVRGIDQFTTLEHEDDESHSAPGSDYAVLCHSGHGVNSYAIQYYLVRGSLRMFLHLGWGGVYMDDDAEAVKIQECFSLADQIVQATMTAGKLAAGERLTIVGSDFYGSYWSAPGRGRQERSEDDKSPAQVLTEVIDWLKTPPPNQPLQQTGPA